MSPNTELRLESDFINTLNSIKMGEAERAMHVVEFAGLLHDGNQAECSEMIEEFEIWSTEVAI